MNNEWGGGGCCSKKKKRIVFISIIMFDETYNKQFSIDITRK